MFGCSSLISFCLLSSIMLLMAESCHSCFACHLQTVYPIPVIFISISTEITSPFQWHTWFAKIMPCSSFLLPEHAHALYITSRISCHVYVVVVYYVVCLFPGCFSRQLRFRS